MKQINFKSIIIGFLLCFCMFLIVGWNGNTDKKGHSHTTNEITYNRYGFADYGSLKKKI